MAHVGREFYRHDRTGASTIRWLVGARGGRSRAYELIAIASGTKTVEEIREGWRERYHASQARKAEAEGVREFTDGTEPPRKSRGLAQKTPETPSHKQPEGSTLGEMPAALKPTP